MGRLRISLVPLLHQGHAEHHRLRYAGIVHCLEERVHPGRLLDEVEEVDVAIDDRVPWRGLTGGCRYLKGANQKEWGQEVSKHLLVAPLEMLKQLLT